MKKRQPYLHVHCRYLVDLSLATRIKHTVQGAKYDATPSTNSSAFERSCMPEFCSDKELFDAEIWPTTSKVMPTGRKARIVLNCADLNLS